MAPERRHCRTRRCKSYLPYGLLTRCPWPEASMMRSATACTYWQALKLPWLAGSSFKLCSLCSWPWSVSTLAVWPPMLA